jgi:hypothetical protein
MPWCSEGCSIGFRSEAEGPKTKRMIIVPRKEEASEERYMLLILYYFIIYI